MEMENHPANQRSAEGPGSGLTIKSQALYQLS